MVDACLIPEVPFVLHGEKGLFKYIEGVLQARGHAVICIAEGAGQARAFSSSHCAYPLCCLCSFVLVRCSCTAVKLRRYWHAAGCSTHALSQHSCF